MGEWWDYLKRHPWVLGGIGIVILLLIYVYMRNRNASSGAVASGIDPQAAALQSQGMQIQGQLDLASGQQGYGLALAQIQANSSARETDAAKTVDLAKIAGDLDLGTKTIAATLQQSHDQLTAQQTGIEAQLEGLRSNNQTSVSLATITANEQLGLAQTTSQTQVAIAGFARDIGLAQAETNREAVAYNNQYQSAALKAQNNPVRMIAGAVGGVLGAFL